MGKFLKNMAFAMVTVVLAIISTSIVQADVTINEDSKELVLYSSDGDLDGDGTEDLWVGFRYEDYEGNNYLDITYNGKSLTSLVDEGYVVEYSAFREYPSGSFYLLFWTSCQYFDITTYNSTDLILVDSYTNIFQFRITTPDGTSMSDRMPTKSDTTFPIVISSTPYNNVDYDFDEKSIKITLKYNDNLDFQNPYIEMEDLFKITDYVSCTPYLATNVDIENVSENVMINNQQYELHYSFVTFYCNFAHIDLSDTKYNSLIMTYRFYLKNVTGIHYKSSPCEFSYRVISYADTSLNPQKKLVITEHENELKVGGSTQLSTSSDEISEDGLIWVSSDESIATVDQFGNVTAISPGTAYIYVTKDDTIELYDYSVVIVVGDELPVNEIEITGTPKKIKVGSKFTLKAIVSPSDATNKNVSWKSSNTKYATVNSKGYVVIKSTGAGKSVKITATAKDGSGVKSTITLKIPTVKVTKITLKGPKTIVAGKSAKITAKVSPSNAANKKVVWKSSNTKYATVNSSGVVKTKKAGKGKKVKITATAKDGSKVKTTITIKIQ